MNELSTYQKVLEPGRWRLQIQAGREVKKVTLLGMRSRWYPLTHVPKEDLHARLQKRPNGEVPDAVILRGTPTVYAIEGPWLMMWPAPAHNWTVAITTAPKVKIHA